MRLEFEQHPKCEGILCSLDRQRIARVRDDEEVPVQRAAGILGTKVDELQDLAEARALRVEEDTRGRTIVVGKELHRFVAKLEPVAFEQVDPDDDEDTDDIEGDDEDQDAGEQDEAAVLAPDAAHQDAEDAGLLRVFAKLLRKALHEDGDDSGGQAPPAAPKPAAVTTVVTTSPAVPTPAAIAPQTNPRTTSARWR